MFKEEFKERYTTIPFAFYRAERSAEHREVITHYHREIELIAMTKGSAEFYIQSKGYSLQEGDVFIIPPYALHRWHPYRYTCHNSHNGTDRSPVHN